MRRRSRPSMVPPPTIIDFELSLGPVLVRLALTAALLAVALSCQSGLDALLLTRLQVERVTLDVLDDFFLQDFALKAFERALQAFAIVNLNFSQRNSPQFQ